MSVIFQDTPEETRFILVPSISSTQLMRLEVNNPSHGDPLTYEFRDAVSPRWHLHYARPLKRYGKFNSQAALDQFLEYFEEHCPAWDVPGHTGNKLVECPRTRLFYRRNVQGLCALFVDHAEFKIPSRIIARYANAIVTDNAHFILAQEYNAILRHILRDDLPPSSNPHILRLQSEILRAAGFFHPNYTFKSVRYTDLKIGTCFNLVPEPATPKLARRSLLKIGKAFFNKATRRMGERWYRLW